MSWTHDACMHTLAAGCCDQWWFKKVDEQVVVTSGKALLNGSRCCWNRQDNVDHIDAFITKKHLDTVVHLDLGQGRQGMHVSATLDDGKDVRNILDALHCMANGRK